MFFVYFVNDKRKCKGLNQNKILSMFVNPPIKQKNESNKKSLAKLYIIILTKNIINRKNPPEKKILPINHKIE